MLSSTKGPSSEYLNDTLFISILPIRSSICGAFFSISGSASSNGLRLLSEGDICAISGRMATKAVMAAVIMPYADENAI